MEDTEPYKLFLCNNIMLVTFIVRDVHIMFGPDGPSGTLRFWRRSEMAG